MIGISNDTTERFAMEYLHPNNVSHEAREWQFHVTLERLETLAEEALDIANKANSLVVQACASAFKMLRNEKSKEALTNIHVMLQLAQEICDKSKDISDSSIQYWENETYPWSKSNEHQAR